MSRCSIVFLKREILNRNRLEGEIFVRAGGKFAAKYGFDADHELLSTCILGLAEGYLGSEDLNSEKFVPNFFLTNPKIWQEKEERSLNSAAQKEPWRKFWKGPRDRLYRYCTIRKYLT